MSESSVGAFIVAVGSFAATHACETLAMGDVVFIGVVSIETWKGWGRGYVVTKAGDGGDGVGWWRWWRIYVVTAGLCWTVEMLQGLRSNGGDGGDGGG